jgi:hypothetical protein
MSEMLPIFSASTDHGTDRIRKIGLILKRSKKVALCVRESVGLQDVS